MIKSQAIQYKDFHSTWYKKWSKLLKQDDGITFQTKYTIHNKAWQNAIILQALAERDYLKEGKTALGFGVGVERVPSALAAMGVKVTATDQDIVSGQQGGWDNGQLTHNSSDLNQYKICPQKQFNQNVSFQNCDMTNIGLTFQGSYDIVWSNCALGHLGSIKASLDFIKNSLNCLKPGGIAVHTTETNVVSNEDTITQGGTVILRRKDITQLFYELRKRGYRCAPLVFDFGSQPQDMQFSFYPYTNDFLLKLSMNGYLLSQMVLVIEKPKQIRPRHSALFQKKREERVNELRMSRFINHNPDLQEYIAPSQPINFVAITPAKRIKRLSLKPAQQKKVSLQFQNVSNRSFYGRDHVFHGNAPLTVATSNPINRGSLIAADSWLSPSRPRTVYRHPNSDWGGIRPNSPFTVEFDICAPRKKGIYAEEFCFTLEGLPTVPQSEFVIQLEVK